MKIHEYQGKAIFSDFGLPIPEGYPGLFGGQGSGGAAIHKQRGTGRPLALQANHLWPDRRHG